MQDAVNTIAKRQVFLEGFQMNITGAGFNGLADNMVHQFDDRGLGSHIPNVFSAVVQCVQPMQVVILDAVDHAIHGGTAFFPVIGLNGFQNVLLTAQNNTNIFSQRNF